MSVALLQHYCLIPATVLYFCNSQASGAFGAFRSARRCAGMGEVVCFACRLSWMACCAFSVECAEAFCVAVDVEALMRAPFNEFESETEYEYVRGCMPPV